MIHPLCSVYYQGLIHFFFFFWLTNLLSMIHSLCSVYYQGLIHFFIFFWLTNLLSMIHPLCSVYYQGLIHFFIFFNWLIYLAWFTHYAVYTIKVWYTWLPYLMSESLIAWRAQGMLITSLMHSFIIIVVLLQATVHDMFQYFISR